MSKNEKTLVNAGFFSIYKGFYLAEKERFELSENPYFTRNFRLVTTFRQLFVVFSFLFMPSVMIFFFVLEVVCGQYFSRLFYRLHAKVCVHIKGG